MVTKTTTAYRWQCLRDELVRMRGMDAFRAAAAIQTLPLHGAPDDAMLSLDLKGANDVAVDRASDRLDSRGIGYRPEDNAMRPEVV
jgi:hypothetical protein